MNKVLKFLEKHLLHILTFIFWMALIWTYLYYRFHLHHTDEEIMRRTYMFLKKEWTIWAFIFVFLYIIRAVIFFPSPILLLIAPWLFGLPAALILVMLWENFSALLGYGLGRFFWQAIVPDSFINRFKYLKKWLQEDTFINVLTARLVFIPFDPLNYFCWIFKARLNWYVWWTLFGTIPWILIFLFAWAWVKNIEKFSLKHLRIDHRYFLYSAIVVILSLIWVYVLKKYVIKKKT